MHHIAVIFFANADTMLTRIAAALAAIMLTSFAALASDIMVINAHAPASLTAVSKTAAVYLDLMNHGAAADVLLSVSSPIADHSQAHETLNENGVMKMRPLERLQIAPHETLAFEPGGRHIMLTGLKVLLKEGEAFSLVLTFEKAGEVQVDVPVVGKLETAGTTEHEHVEGE